MTPASNLLALGACVVSLAAAAATGAAAADLQTFAQYSQSSTAQTLAFDQSTSGTGGTFHTIGAPIVNFSFLTVPVFTQAQFMLLGHVADGTPATMTGPTDYQQDGIDGTFSFQSTSAFTLNSVTYAAGTNLLSATFSGASINSTSSSGALSDSTLSGKMITFTSSVIDTSMFSEEDFSFGLTGARPVIFAQPGQSLASFTAASTGSFSGGAVPEPASWALMLVGFGGLGAMLRSRRQRAAYAKV